ncbi:MAG TPA: amidohydrolase family protein [Polyangiales bacterium]
MNLRRLSWGWLFPAIAVSTAARADTVCSQLQPLASGVCAVTPGSSDLLIRGDVLAPDQIYRGGSVHVSAAGLIDCVGCNCDADGATVLQCPDGVIAPGLINAHDHLTYTHNQPRVGTSERYEHRHEWRLGLNGHTRIVAPGSAPQAAIQFAEIRQLMSGTTSIVGSGVGAGLLRNLDGSVVNSQLPITVEVAGFPLGDSNGPLLTSGCAYPHIVTPADIAGDTAFLAHASEGISSAAHNEFACLSSTSGQVLTGNKTAFQQSLGITAVDQSVMATSGTSLVWSPRSNLALYGDTAQVTAAARLGVTIALGTDWIITGSMNLLRELACASSFNAQYLNQFFSDRALFEMVTSNAARATGASDQIGSLTVGRWADIAIFDARVHADYRAVLDAGPTDVALVVRGAKPLYGDDNLLQALSTNCEQLDVCGSSKRLCLVGEISASYAALQNSGYYPAFECGPPRDEPTCTPARSVSVSGSSVYDGVSRADDPDGDGLSSSVDNCPSVFNPVRPLDLGVQADADGDHLGDACDAEPLQAAPAVPATRMGGLCWLALGFAVIAARSRYAHARQRALRFWSRKAR